MKKTTQIMSAIIISPILALSVPHIAHSDDVDYEIKTSMRQYLEIKSNLTKEIKNVLKEVQTEEELTVLEENEIQEQEEIIETESFFIEETTQEIIEEVIETEEETREEETVEEVILPDTVYTTVRVHIRYEPDINSNILVTAEAGTMLVRTGINVVEGWDSILINDIEYYIANEYLTALSPGVVANDISQQIQDAEISLEDLRYLSAIIYAEAGNQCLEGQLAVGIIVVNRSESSAFANGIYNVIYESGQFAPTMNGAMDRALNLYDTGQMPLSCMQAAVYALRGNKIVSYNDNVYDLSDYYFFSRQISNPRLVIQDHMFR